MDRASLAVLEHENMIEALATAAALAPKALVERADGVALIATGLPPRLFNQVLVERDSVRPEAIAAAVAKTRDRGDPFVVSLRAGTDDRYLPLMAQLGLARCRPSRGCPAWRSIRCPRWARWDRRPGTRFDG